MRVLLLSGTVDGQRLAEAITATGHEIIESVAGRTRQTRETAVGRTGGFGGAEGLACYLTTAGIDAVIDATHPFAATMTRHAAEACAVTDTPLLRFSRPGWQDHPLADSWTWVTGHNQAATVTAKLGGRALLTVGRQPLPHYGALRNVVARVAEWTAAPAPDGWLILAERGPFTVDSERRLLADEHIDVLVSKDSGGESTAAKLVAAHERTVPVVMVARPETPDNVVAVSTATQVLDWLGSSDQHRPRGITHA